MVRRPCYKSHTKGCDGNSEKTGFECSPPFVILRLEGYDTEVPLRPAIGRLSLFSVFHVKFEEFPNLL